MIDVNDIKAGTYELVAEQWDKPTSKPNEPFDFVRYRKGDTVELDVAEARRLVLAGAVVKPGEIEKRNAEAARIAYQAALALVPDTLRDELDPDADPDDPATEFDISDSIDKLMEYVGDDKERAAAVLEAEKAKSGDPRASLVTKLDAVLTAES